MKNQASIGLIAGLASLSCIKKYGSQSAGPWMLLGFEDESMTTKVYVEAELKINCTDIDKGEQIFENLFNKSAEKYMMFVNFTKSFTGSLRKFEKDSKLYLGRSNDRFYRTVQLNPEGKRTEYTGLQNKIAATMTGFNPNALFIHIQNLFNFNYLIQSNGRDNNIHPAPPFKIKIASKRREFGMGDRTAVGYPNFQTSVYTFLLEYPIELREQLARSEWDANRFTYLNRVFKEIYLEAKDLIPEDLKYKTNYDERYAKNWTEQNFLIDPDWSESNNPNGYPKVVVASIVPPFQHSELRRF